MGSRGEFAFVVMFVLVQLVFLADRVQSDSGDTLLDLAVSGLTLPVANGVDGVVRAGEAIALGWRDRQRLSTDNARLRAELAELRKRTAEQDGALLELRRLRAALDYQPPAGRPVHVANVVYANHRDLFRRLAVRVLDEAAMDAVRSKAAVVTEDGLVGRIVSPLPPYGEVQLITDRSSSVGVMVERTRRQGLLRGAGDRLELHYLPLQADVRVGDRIVTAGIDGIYPRGVQVGTVISVRPSDELFHEVVVAPAVDFTRLDQVFLVPAEPLPERFLDNDLSPEELEPPALPEDDAAPESTLGTPPEQTEADPEESTT